MRSNARHIDREHLLAEVHQAFFGGRGCLRGGSICWERNAAAEINHFLLVVLSMRVAGDWRPAVEPRPGCHLSVFHRSGTCARAQRRLGQAWPLGYGGSAWRGPKLRTKDPGMRISAWALKFGVWGVGVSSNAVHAGTGDMARLDAEQDFSADGVFFVRPG